MSRSRRRTATPTPLEDVATLMVEQMSGGCPWWTRSDLVGIVTKRDIVRSIAAEGSRG